MLCCSAISSHSPLCSVDVDDCTLLENDCDHICHNFEGGYRCSCEEGYVLLADNRTCRDVDECSASPCHHTCINLLGSYRCECDRGYVLDEDGSSCIGTRSCKCKQEECYQLLHLLSPPDVDECLSLISGCDHECDNTEGSYECSCRTGYRLAGDNRTCQDLDECSRPNPCSQICVNLQGEFRCECEQGFVLAENRTSCEGG